MFDIDPLHMQIKQQDVQVKIVNFLAQIIGDCSSKEMLKLNVWVLWFDSKYRPYQLQKRIINELDDIEIEMDGRGTKFREWIVVKCMERDNGLISATLFFD